MRTYDCSEIDITCREHCKRRIIGESLLAFTLIENRETASKYRTNVPTSPYTQVYIDIRKNICLKAGRNFFDLMLVHPPDGGGGRASRGRERRSGGRRRLIGRGGRLLLLLLLLLLWLLLLLLRLILIAVGTDAVSHLEQLVEGVLARAVRLPHHVVAAQTGLLMHYFYELMPYVLLLGTLLRQIYADMSIS